MEIKKRYFQKYLHNIATEQLAEEYMQKGYQVSKEEKIGKYQADLIVRKGNETIVIEVKSGKMTPEKKEAIAAIGDYVRSKSNYKFLVAIATPPKEKKLEINKIEELLVQAMLDDFPSELDELSSHTSLESITDIDIDEILIDGKSILVKGEGVVSVELQMGSDGDQDKGNGLQSNDNFPFDFEVILEYDEDYLLQISDVKKLVVDTSSYYD